MKFIPPLFTIFAAISATVCADDKVTFDAHVKPIFREHCAACHSAEGATSNLALDNFQASLSGGASGKVLAAGDPGGSRLWRMINHEETPVMPPGKKIPGEQLAVVKKWIEGGLLQNGDSKPMAAAKPALAEVAVDASGRPEGEPAMPQGVSREPVIYTPHAGPIGAVAGSPWAPLVAVAGQRQVAMYHAESGAHLAILPFPEGQVRVVRFSRDGSVLLVAGGQDAARGIAALYDVKSGDRLTTIGDELDTVLAADLSADRSLIALGGPRKRVRVYRVADGSLVYEITKHTDWVTAVAFSPDGKLLASADRVGGLLTWDAATGNPRGDLRGHAERITGVDWRADSQALASVSEDDTLRLWKPDGTAIKSVGAHGAGALGVAFAPDGRLATTGRDNQVKLWKPDGEALSTLPALPGMGLAIAFVHEGQRVVASDFSGVAALYDSAGQETAKLTANPPTIAMRLAAVEAELSQLSPAAEAARTALTEARQRSADAVVIRTAHEAKVAETLAAVESQKQGVATTEAALATATKAVADATAAKTAPSEALKVAQTAHAEAQRDLDDLPESPPAGVDAAEHQTKRAKAAEVLAARQQAVADAQVQLTAVENSMMEAEKSRASAEANLATQRTAVDAATKALTELQQASLPNLDELAAEVAKLTAQAADSLSAAAAKQSELAALVAERAAAEARAAQLASALAAQQVQVAAAEAAAKSAADALAAAQANQATAEASSKELAQQLAALRKQLAERSKAEAAAKEAAQLAAAAAEAAAKKLADDQAATARAAARQALEQEVERVRKELAK